MKKINFIWPLLSIVLLFAACQKEEEDIFDGTASQRLNAKCKEIDDLLKSSSDGWLMNYYPDPEYSGAYNMLLSFSGEEDVTMQGDQFFPNGKHASLYAVESTQGPVLNFNTANRVLHQLADPQLFYSGEGMRGDIEFLWKGTSENNDTIYLKGKKRSYPVKLVRFSGNWDDYFKKVNGVINAYSSRYFKKISITGGEEYVIGGYHPINRNVFPITTENNATLEPSSTSMIGFTATGTEFYEPMVLGNKQIQHFTYNTDANKFIISDPGIEGSMQAIDAPPFVFGNSRDSIFYSGIQYLFSNPDYKVYEIMQSIRTKLASIPAQLVGVSFIYSGSTYRLAIISYSGGQYSTLAAAMTIGLKRNTNRTDKINLYNADTSVYGDYAGLLNTEIKSLTTLIAGGSPNVAGKDYIVMPNYNYSNFTLGSCDRDFSITINVW